jgi:menaquinone-dependent protoporphyrinogen oxidase
MRVLVTAASKHGATQEIADAIARELAGRAIETAVQPVESASPEGFDAVVLGSAVYAGRWLPAARDFTTAHAAALRDRRVWLFSSGPVGDPPKPDELPVDVAPMMEASRAAGHTVFAGRLDRKRLSFGEKAIVVALRAPEGDFRDWDAVRAWAGAIADELGVRPR